MRWGPRDHSCVAERWRWSRLCVVGTREAGRHGSARVRPRNCREGPTNFGAYGLLQCRGQACGGRVAMRQQGELSGHFLSDKVLDLVCKGALANVAVCDCEG